MDCALAAAAAARARLPGEDVKAEKVELRLQSGIVLARGSIVALVLGFRWDTSYPNLVNILYKVKTVVIFLSFKAHKAASRSNFVHET